MTDSEKKPKRARKDEFKKVTRELGCDEPEAAFDEALGKIAKAKTKAPPAAKRAKPKAR